MTDLSTKTCCVVDNGLFVSFARHIAPAFKKLYYAPTWRGPFAKSNQLVVGKGFNEMEMVKFPLKKADEIDLWVFLDVYHSDLQLYLADRGARVWGSRAGDEMELNRWQFKQYLKKIGLPVQRCEKVVGFDDLRKYLKGVKKKVFVKTSFVRGDFETFPCESYELIEPRIDDLEHHLGAVKADYEFIVEDDIPDAVEVGYDGFTIDGQFPSHAMMGVEVKDVGMIGVVKEYLALADPVKVVNTALAPAFKGYNYRGFFCSEIRYTKDKKPFLIDPCCRLGTPSNELLQDLFDNWPLTLWDGAEGKCTSPTVKSKFGVLAVIHSEFAVDNWHSISYPKSIDNFVKLRFHTRIGGKDFVAPQVVGLPDLGVVVGTGDTILAAIGQCKERASQIKGFQTQVSLESIDKALETIKDMEKLGIKFAEKVPTAEEVREC